MIDTVLLKVASRCNLDCTYCYVYHLGDNGWKDNPKYISLETIDAIGNAFSELYRTQQKSFAVVLHGGEPFLLPKSRLEHLFATLRKVLPDYTSISIQTNGVMISQELIGLLDKYRVNFAISLDGPQKIHDKYRIFPSKRGSYETILENLNWILHNQQARKLFTGCLAVIDPHSDAQEVYQFFKSLNIPSVNFLLRDGNHDRLPYGKANFDSTEYGKWLVTLWNCYFSDPNPIPIALFDNYVKLLLGGFSSKEGSGTEESGILVIDTNGEITKNNTLKSTGNKADKFTQKWHITNGILPLLNSEEYRKYQTSQHATVPQCLSCEYFAVCGGGMPLYRWSEANKFNNPSVFCTDHKLIIQAISNSLEAFYATQSFSNSTMGNSL